MKYKFILFSPWLLQSPGNYTLEGPSAQVHKFLSPRRPRNRKFYTPHVFGVVGTGLLLNLSTLNRTGPEA